MRNNPSPGSESKALPLPAQVGVRAPAPRVFALPPAPQVVAPPEAQVPPPSPAQVARPQPVFKVPLPPAPPVAIVPEEQLNLHFQMQLPIFPTPFPGRGRSN
ncbi:hypothetical protein QAD02_004499 [Eretmocerus hayati]|uniref:Uncharacterized protein n=1 Tax=Eretmocerus hayati TaxID=131215 RepID=A0ACC2NQ47_9HYME|nr:hypothetical protein QAD02_004499 [Eretmocerus hayati]